MWCRLSWQRDQLKWRAYKAVLKPLLLSHAKSAGLKWVRERMYDAATLALVQRGRANPVQGCIVRCGGFADSTAGDPCVLAPVTSRDWCACRTLPVCVCGSATSS